MTDLANSPLRVLVVEDEPDLREVTVAFLELEGISAHGVGSAREADAWLRTQPVDIVILDLGLPEQDGITWLVQSNQLEGKGLIIATARGELNDRLLGLNAGADAYLVKPVALEEMVAVVHSVARRLTATALPLWRLNPVSWLLESPDGATVKLTRSETVLLKALAASPGETVARDPLIRSLGHQPAAYDLRRMEILIRRLRNKVREKTGRELPVETVHGIGYAFTARIEVRSS